MDTVEKYLGDDCGTTHGKKKKKKKMDENVEQNVDGLFDNYEELLAKMKRVDKRKAKVIENAWKKFITIVNTTVREAEFRSKGLVK